MKQASRKRMEQALEMNWGCWVLISVWPIHECLISLHVEIITAVMIAAILVYRLRNTDVSGGKNTDSEWLLRYLDKVLWRRKPGKACILCGTQVGSRIAQTPEIPQSALHPSRVCSAVSMSTGTPQFLFLIPWTLGIRGDEIDPFVKWEWPWCGS